MEEAKERDDCCLDDEASVVTSQTAVTRLRPVYIRHSAPAGRIRAASTETDGRGLT